MRKSGLIRLVLVRSRLVPRGLRDHTSHPLHDLFQDIVVRAAVHELLDELQMLGVVLADADVPKLLANVVRLPSTSVSVLHVVTALQAA